MVNEIRASLPEPEPFNWEREYGPLWDGDKCSAFWLEPGPEDVLMIDGIRAPLRDHQRKRELCACGEDNPSRMYKRGRCIACEAFGPGYRELQRLN